MSQKGEQIVNISADYSNNLFIEMGVNPTPGDDHFTDMVDVELIPLQNSPSQISNRKELM